MLEREAGREKGRKSQRERERDRERRHLYMHIMLCLEVDVICKKVKLNQFTFSFNKVGACVSKKEKMVL